MPTLFSKLAFQYYLHQQTQLLKKIFFAMDINKNKLISRNELVFIDFDLSTRHFFIQMFDKNVDSCISLDELIKVSNSETKNLVSLKANICILKVSYLWIVKNKTAVKSMATKWGNSEMLKNQDEMYSFLKEIHIKDKEQFIKFLQNDFKLLVKDKMVSIGEFISALVLFLSN